MLVIVIMVVVIVVAVAVVFVVVVDVVGGGGVLSFQRRKGWCSCAYFFVHFFIAIFCRNYYLTFFGFCCSLFFRRAYLHRGVNVVVVKC